MSYHPAHEKRALMTALLPGLRATAARHRAAVEELAGGPLEYLDLGAGRDVAVPPLVRAPFCGVCFGQRRIWEPSALGLCPVVCDGCGGTGHA